MPHLPVLGYPGNASLPHLPGRATGSLGPPLHGRGCPEDLAHLAVAVYASSRHWTTPLLS
ncbi:hypothetical protein [Ktedonobacter racemifer]|uniref:hypothetical protein n=1 Tax=Ktedonobacter racemifer TaxID=363277 RepID=UPI00146AC641|nr:hypothetical protein [Ktedonobacter racemifer]